MCQSCNSFRHLSPFLVCFWLRSVPEHGYGDTLKSGSPGPVVAKRGRVLVLAVHPEVLTVQLRRHHEAVVLEAAIGGVHKVEDTGATYRGCGYSKGGEMHSVRNRS